VGPGDAQRDDVRPAIGVEVAGGDATLGALERQLADARVGAARAQHVARSRLAAAGNDQVVATIAIEVRRGGLDGISAGVEGGQPVAVEDQPRRIHPGAGPGCDDVVVTVAVGIEDGGGDDRQPARRPG
jgi:hypothetical protein